MAVDIKYSKKYFLMLKISSFIFFIEKKCFFNSFSLCTKMFLNFYLLPISYILICEFLLIDIKNIFGDNKLSRIFSLPTHATFLIFLQIMYENFYKFCDVSIKAVFIFAHASMIIKSDFLDYKIDENGRDWNCWVFFCYHAM